MMRALGTRMSLLTLAGVRALHHLTIIATTPSVGAFCPGARHGSSSVRLAHNYGSSQLRQFSRGVVKSTDEDSDTWETPSDYTVDDDHLMEDERRSKARYNAPPDFTVVDEDEGDKELSSSSWIDKNAKAGLNTSALSSGADKPRRDRARKSFDERRGPRDGNDKPRRDDRARKSFDERRGARPRDGNDNRQNRTFRQDFRGTRVFVQGLPLEASWQDVKDHFRVAGNVVFASVSKDSRTGQSKGCGVVQFETTEMAQNAIQVMRDHPLDGHQLYVREDVQEREGAQLQNPMPRGSEKRSTIPQTWTCADESSIEHLAEEEKSAVFSLIRARDDARKRRNFDAADDMREELKLKHGVFLDDRLKMWWVSPDGRQVPQSISDLKGEGRWDGPKQWRQIPTIPENDLCVDANLVNALLTQRDVARREKDFATADALLEEARTSPDGDLFLRIHDESRSWRVWTEEPPPRELMYGDKGKSRKSPVEQCIEIVLEHAPEKLGEVELLLEKFKGREYNILKKLKQRYLK